MIDLTFFFVWSTDSEGKLNKEIDNEGTDLDKTKYFYKTPEESEYWEEKSVFFYYLLFVLAALVSL